jgi:hypothetical protein
MLMHKTTAAIEKGLPPDPAILEGVGKLVEEGVKEKVFLSGEGLKPSSQRVHIAYKGGKRTITDGPFTEAKELVAGFALMRVRSKEEAISWCDKFAARRPAASRARRRHAPPTAQGCFPAPSSAPRSDRCRRAPEGLTARRSPTHPAAAAARPAPRS